ncbi:SLC13 family permease [Sphingomonas sp.]|uniref:SLC13 family permease n=1 Tax=Sphingomonas sp. TaxID=28214 RepID=UPI001AFD1D7F|nr:SLC13 family permease [Sphingomonas sp.]MBO9712445.1 anion permease [Sphingomonas sp.]
MSPAALSGLTLAFALALFVSGRVRHDAVALLALGLSIALGLVAPADALSGFADPAVATVAAVLIVGRAVELSGAPTLIARRLIPAHAPFALQLAAVLLVGALLSALMNNIAALVITMPIAAEIGRRSGRGAGATLMPLAFATILGGMTTLIGTPANLILSSVREERLGAPFGFFAMTPVGGAVAVVGFAYLAFVGWRLLPGARRERVDRSRPWRVFEVEVADRLHQPDTTDLARALRKHGTRILTRARERLLLLSRRPARELAERVPLVEDIHPSPHSSEETVRVVVAHGSFLVGLGHDAISAESAGALRVIAAGPRAARMRRPLAELRIAEGDQLFIRGEPRVIAAFVPRARLLEIDRQHGEPPPDLRRMALALGIFLLAVALAVAGLVPLVLAFGGAALAIALLRLIPPEELYRSVDWSVIVLLAAMIPVGQSFETSGAAAAVAQWLGGQLAGGGAFVSLAALCALTLVLSVFLNNVATAIIMGPLALDTAALLGLDPDAALLAVLIGASSDFLTPIGHQNNLLVMGPGGYRFTDYARMGAPLVALVVLVTAALLAG